MKNETIKQYAETQTERIEIIEIDKLHGSQSSEMCRDIYFMSQTNTTLKMVKIILKNGSVMTESGALYYLKGNIESKVPVGGVTGILGKTIKSKLTNEKAFNPIYSGTGEIMLEPTFQHYAMIQLEDESVIVDKGLYYCSIGNIKVEPIMQSNFSSALMGGEGLFQTKITGNGWVVLQIPVPMEEIEMFDIYNEKVQVDGNFALLRSSDINFSVKKSTKKIIGTITSGEGMLQTFEGTGQVWLAPTAPVYKKLQMGGIGEVNLSQGSSNNEQ